MIPKYPAFKKLSLADKLELQQIIQKNPTHSDFNLAGLWSYDTGSEVEISRLFGNLLMQSRDYVTKKPFYSFLGDSQLNETIQTIFNMQHKLRIPKEIKLVSEHTVKKIPDTSTIHILEDRDNFDYILSVKDLTSYNGNSLRSKRNFLNRFRRFYGEQIETIVIRMPDPKTHDELFSLFNKWERTRAKDRTETQIERIAMKRLIEASHYFEIYAVCAYAKSALIGFSINEVIHDNHGVIHFEKGDTEFVGIFEHVKQQSAIHLHSLGCDYINYEQDLGIEGLRKAKLSYKPIRMGKKFTLQSKE